MPLYVYENQEHGVTVELVRPVEQRDEPVTITLQRRTAPERVGVVAGGIGETTFTDTIRNAYHTLEQERGSRFTTQHNPNVLKRIYAR